MFTCAAVSDTIGEAGSCMCFFKWMQDVCTRSVARLSTDHTPCYYK